MTVRLTKGKKVSLTKEGVKKFIVGLGWELLRDSKVDLDAVAFLCKDKNGAPWCPKDEYFVFYGNKEPASLNGGIIHTGDNRTGGTGDSDDEQIIIDFDKINALAPDITEVSIIATIYEAAKKNHTFGLLKKAYLKIYKEDGEEVIFYDLDESFPKARSVQVGSFDKDAASGDWSFTAVGLGFEQELGDICDKYGIETE